MESATKRLVSILILLLLSLPTIASLIGFGDYDAISENRNRLSKPTINEVREQGFRAINNWYNDNFGLRDFLIRVQHQIDYSLFKYSKTLLFNEVNGEEYLFYRSVVEDEQIYNEKTTEEKREQIVHAFEAIDQYLDEREIEFKFLIPPQKNEVLTKTKYKFPINRPEKTMYLDMEDRYRKSSLSDNYVSILEPLISANENIPVFYKTDFHWNDYGAMVGFGEVVNSYANDIGLPDVYSLDNVEVTNIFPDRNAAQLSSLSVLDYDVIEITTNKPMEIYSEPSKDDAFPDYVIWDNYKNAVFDKAVLVIGDSYTLPALNAFNDTHSGIVELFPRVYFCHCDYAKGAIINLPKDVGLVVFERIESAYYYMDDVAEMLLEDS